MSDETTAPASPSSTATPTFVPTPESLRDLERRILAADKGEGDWPPREELRAALDYIRGNSSRKAAASPTARAASKSLPLDLTQLFAKP